MACLLRVTRRIEKSGVSQFDTALGEREMEQELATLLAENGCEEGVGFAGVVGGREGLKVGEEFLRRVHVLPGVVFVVCSVELLTVFFGEGVQLTG